MIAPEPYLSACMRVVYRALLHARLMGWSGSVDSKHLADLMDAVHNIPDLVRHWEDCDTERMRAFLKNYEETWLARGGLPLCEIFDQAIAGK
jgi:hypothetical protein